MKGTALVATDLNLGNADNTVDIVFADETGVLVIPAALKDAVLAKAIEISAKEIASNAALKAAKPSR